MRELGLGSQELFLMSLVLKNAKKAKNKIKKIVRVYLLLGQQIQQMLVKYTHFQVDELLVGFETDNVRVFVVGCSELHLIVLIIWTFRGRSEQKVMIQALLRFQEVTEAK